VSASKLKRAQDRVVGARPYAQALADVIGQLYSPELAERFPLLRQPGQTARGGGVRRAALLLITANRGLCGAFNANLIREARRRPTFPGRLPRKSLSSSFLYMYRTRCTARWSRRRPRSTARAARR